ncbi:MAG TPA: glycosyltransferase, partial [Bryobacteraceae bacterium]|nr:glycosyltransferase [Bryobacteraceae bacterium]
WGSLGDVNPYIALASELQRRGHDVTIASSEFYRERIGSEGIHFAPVRPDLSGLIADAEIRKRIMDLRSGTEYLVTKLLVPNIHESYEDLLAAAEPADLLISHSVTYALPIVAEKLRKPWLSVALAPLAFFSSYEPPVTPLAPWINRLGILGRWPYGLLLKAINSETRQWAEPIVQLRNRVGLAGPAENPILRGMFSPHGTLALFSPLLASPQPDWPNNTVITGFTWVDRRQAEDHRLDQLDDFLQDGPPPVVFTLGSAAVMDPGSYFQEAMKATKLLGTRSILLVGPMSQPGMDNVDRKSTLVLDYAPFSRVMPRASIIVHQGGIGTLGQAMRSANPMLVVPFSHDQPDNAYRAARLGIARVQNRQNFEARAVARQLRALDSPKYRERARTVGRQVEQEDGARVAADYIDHFGSTGTLKRFETAERSKAISSW